MTTAVPCRKYCLPLNLAACCLLIAILAGAGCSGDSKTSDADKQPTIILTKKSDPITGKFTLLPPEETGLNFVAEVEAQHQMARLYHGVFAAGGIAIGDVDGDGLVDVFCVGGPKRNRLFKQISPFKFVDVTDPSGVGKSVSAWGAGASFVDIENDGDLDLYVCNYDNANELWINNGNGIFVDRARAFGLDIDDSSVMAYFGDFDGDRFPDLFLLTNRAYRPDGFVEKYLSRKLPSGKLKLESKYSPYFNLVVNPDESKTLVPRGRPDLLYRNELGNKFRPISGSGVDHDGLGVSAVLWDFDSDNDLDIYVCNEDHDSDCLYENNGRGRFDNVIKDVFKTTSWLSRGSDVADINNDGRSDLLTVDTSGTTPYLANLLSPDYSVHQHVLDKAEPYTAMRNVLHVNAGRIDDDSLSTSYPLFVESAQLSGIASADWAWAPVFGDFDNDGFCDVLITNGHVRNFNDEAVARQSRDDLRQDTYWNRFIDQPSLDNANVAFRNTDGIKFENKGEAWGVNKTGASYAAAKADLDQDGDLDLIVMNLDEPISVYRNDISDNNSLTICLEGTRSNRGGIGAKVSVETSTGTQLKEYSPHRGLLSSHQPILQFGLGTATSVDRIRVRWPSGVDQELTNVTANQILTIVEPDSAPGFTSERSVPRFEHVSNTSIPKRVEKSFNDYALQPNLPYKLSQLGPGIALCDLDRDGRDEVFASSPAWSTKVLGLRNDNDSLKKEKLFFQSMRLPMESAREEMAPLFFDADGDEDTDVYVVNGGVEFDDRNSRLGDHLLVFLRTAKGAGYGSVGPTSLPNTEFSGSVVAAADYDRDGDLDLFVGGRFVRGEYPTSPRSMLLRNDTSKPDEPKFSDATVADSKNLQFAGMVTSALWSDVNNDGWMDLLVTTEWGPIRVYFNRDGRLSEATEVCGLANHLGWWNGINGRDVDNDGDIDYVVTNFGESTKRVVSNDSPSKIYYGKFNRSQSSNIVQSHVSAAGEFPVLGKSQLEFSMPFIKEKFPTIHDFSSAKLSDIFDASELAAAKSLEVNDLRTSLLINDGTGKFQVQPLPWLAQIAPAFGVVATDFDADGMTDLFIAQNFYGLRHETGKMAGGLSLLLTGTSFGDFKAEWPEQSGIAITGDAKGVACFDMDNDFRPDIAVGVNNDRVKFYRNRITDNVPIVIRLRGDKENRKAIGARVQLELEDGSTQTAEVYAGGGYLSQSTSDLYFGLGDTGRLKNIRIRWPDGTHTDYVPPSAYGLIRISKK